MSVGISKGGVVLLFMVPSMSAKYLRFSGLAARSVRHQDNDRILHELNVG
jgi:hypothetical protein